MEQVSTTFQTIGTAYRKLAVKNSGKFTFFTARLKVFFKISFKKFTHRQQSDFGKKKKQ